MNDACFLGRTALLTGAASGMGLRAAQRLAKAGARVVMCDIDAAALEKAAADGCAFPARVRRESPTCLALARQEVSSLKSRRNHA